MESTLSVACRMQCIESIGRGTNFKNSSRRQQRCVHIKRRAESWSTATLAALQRLFLTPAPIGGFERCCYLPQLADLRIALDELRSFGKCSIQRVGFLMFVECLGRAVEKQGPVESIKRCQNKDLCVLIDFSVESSALTGFDLK